MFGGGVCAKTVETNTRAVRTSGRTAFIGWQVELGRHFREAGTCHSNVFYGKRRLKFPKILLRFPASARVSCRLLLTMWRFPGSRSHSCKSAKPEMAAGYSSSAWMRRVTVAGLPEHTTPSYRCRLLKRASHDY